MLVHCRVTPPAVCRRYQFLHLGEERQSGVVPCLRKQRDGRSLNPGPPDLEFEVLTSQSVTPPQETEKKFSFNPAVCLYSSTMWIILNSCNIKRVNSIGKNVFMCSMVRMFYLCGIQERR